MSYLLRRQLLAQLPVKVLVTKGLSHFQNAQAWVLRE